MFKKGFKALKSIGKKSKKKDRGDAGQQEDQGASAETSSQAGEASGSKGKTTPQLSGTAALVGKSPRDNQTASGYAAAGSSSQRPQTSAATESPPPSYGAVAAGQSAISREKAAEESVLEMMLSMKAAKEAGKDTNNPPNKPPSDSDDDDSSSSESESPFQKKTSKEERNEKGLSASSSDSEDDSWGDTSDILPPEKKLTSSNAASTSNNATAPAAAGKAATVAASAAPPKPAESDSDSWGDTDEDEDLETINNITKEPVKPPVNISGRISDPTSQLSDSEVGDEMAKPHGTASAVLAAPPDSSVTLTKSKELETQVKSDSESVWSDEELNDTVKSNNADAGGDSLLNKHSAIEEEVMPLNVTSVGSAAAAVSTTDSAGKIPSVTRQESEESLWSEEDDDIEDMAAPVTATGTAATGSMTMGAAATDTAGTAAAGNKQSAVDDSVGAGIQPLSDAVTPYNAEEKLKSTLTDVSSKKDVVSGQTQDSDRVSPLSVSSFGSNEDKDYVSPVNLGDSAELSTRLAEAESLHASLKHDNEELITELSAVKNEKEKLSFTLNSLESEVEELRSRNEKDAMLTKLKYDDVTKKLKVIMDENERLISEQNDTSELRQEAARLKEEIEKLKAQKDATEGDLSKENVELREENSELKQSVSDWQSKYSEVEGSSRQHQQACLVLEEKVKDLKNDLEMLELQKTTLETEKGRAYKELEVLSKELKNKSGFESMKQEMDAMTLENTSKIEKLTRELAISKDAHKQELQQIEQIHKQEIEQLNSANDRKSQAAEARVASLNQQIDSLHSDNKDLQTRYSKLRTEQSEKSKNFIPQTEYIEQQKENEMLIKKVRELEKVLKQEQLAVVPEQTTSVSNMHLSMSVSSSDDEDSHRGKVNGHTSVPINSILQKELDRKEEKIKQLVSESASLQKNVAKLQSETRTLSSQLQATQEKSGDLKVQNSKLREKLNIRDQEVTMELNKKLEGELTADAQHGKLKQQIVMLESQIVRLKDANSRLELRLKNVSAELGAKESLLRSQGEGSAHVNATAILDSDLVRIQTELAQVRSSLESERSTFMAALDEKEKEVSTEAAEKESVKAALDEVTKTLMYLQEDLSNNYMPLSSHQDALGKAADQEDKVRRELIALRGSLDSYSKEAIEAKNVCSMQNILINEKDRELRDKEKELKSLRRELDTKAEALSNVNSQLQQSNRDRDRDRDRLRDEMMAMTRSLEPHTATINYKTMYDELKVDKEREKATTDQLIERLKWEISTLEERLEKAKAELQDKIKLETNYLLAQGEAERFKQEASDLMKKVTRLEERVDHQQRDSDYLKESRHEIGASNQNLKDENSRLRENNTELKSRLTQMERELSSYSVTRDEMEAALATAKLTTDVNDMSKQENDTEMQLERKHKMVLYRQAKALKTEVNEKTVKLQEAEKQVERLRNKNTKLKMENSALHARIKERGAVDARLSWDAATGLTQTDIFQQEVQQLQSQLHSTTNDMQAQARKAKARKYDLNYYQARAEDLEKQNQQLSSKLNESLMMINAAERTAADLRSHIAELNNRIHQLEQLENSTDLSIHELQHSHDETSRSLQKKNRELERDLRQLKNKLSMAEVELAATDRLRASESSTNGRLPRSRSSSPRYTKTKSERLRDSPTTEYEKDRRALTRAAWAVLDDHGLGPPADQRVFENLDRIWRRNASRPTRRV